MTHIGLIGDTHYPEATPDRPAAERANGKH